MAATPVQTNSPVPVGKNYLAVNSVQTVVPVGMAYPVYLMVPTGMNYLVYLMGFVDQNFLACPTVPADKDLADRDYLAY